MKKTLLLTFLCIAITSNAQVKVDSTGAFSVGRDAMTNTWVTIGDNNYNQNVAESGMCVYLHGYKASANNTKKYYGISSIISGNVLGQEPSIGVYGRVGTGPNGKRFGVVGCASNIQNGVGVYGTAGGYGSSYGETVNTSYAGYFAGPTYVSGTLTATEVITPSDITLKENITSIMDEEENKGSTLGNLMNMNVIKYTYKPKEYQRDSDEYQLYESEEDAAKAEELAKQRIREMAEQKHYGLSAQELKEIYPDLVREGQDGILAVNYVELVPILIRSIQELKAELDEVKGENNAMKARTAAFEENETTDIGDATSIPVAASLAQNTPNPFSERTTIRFTLPENARNAFIYIFDMSGKMYKQIPVDSSMQSVSIEGYELRAGMYIYSLVIGGKEIQTRRMILSK